jgi:hypothetical protein
MTDEDLRTLRDLPRPDAPDQARAARAAFVSAFRGEPWHVRAFRPLARAAVPAVLAGIAVVYLSWAVNAASMVMH